MRLTVVIVNYNVKSFLDQCLDSVRQSIGLSEGRDYEITVVDNRSVDGSVEMVRTKYPSVRVIANTENIGFAKANNQAIRQSSAEYVLLLNPDTLIENDTLQKCVRFMDEHPASGGLGVKMIDGQGKYLRESKRGVPTPATSFYKITGLCRLFPKSKKFAAYYMGHLHPDSTAEVEILSGAFMMLRRETLEKTGLLDETFFMYGEDIDLSYRILLAGYKNYYFPQTRIIHYKGESTKKGSLNYVLVFYKAMEIFAHKYFSKGRYRLYFHLIRFAIWLRAALAATSRALKAVLLPLLDFTTGVAVLVGISYAWARLFFHKPDYYPDIYRDLFLPLYAALLVIGCWAWRAYRKPISLVKTCYGFLSGMAGFLLLGALIGAKWQFSRFTAVAGGFAALAVALAVRALLSGIAHKSFPLGTRRRKNYLVIGSGEECVRVTDILKKEGTSPERVFTLEPKDALSAIREQVAVNRIGQIIFCSKDLNFDRILLLVSLMRKEGVECKIIAADSDLRVGYKF